MKTLIGDVMREAYRRNWITTRDGNCSIYEGHKDYIYVSPSGIRKYKIEWENLLTLKWDDKFDERGFRKFEEYEGRRNPSTEINLHRILQDTLNDVEYPKPYRCVLHLHPTNCVAAMYAGWDLRYVTREFPELTRYSKVGHNTGYETPGSVDLAHVTCEGFGVYKKGDVPKFDIVGQEAHGVTAIGNDPWGAFEHIERLEHVCEIVLASGVQPPPRERQLEYCVLTAGVEVK